MGTKRDDWLMAAVAIAVGAGMLLQVTVAPWESPGGFYEVAGLWIAGPGRPSSSESMLPS